MRAAPRPAMEDLGARWMAAMRAGDFAAAWDVSDRVLAKPFNDNEFDKPRHLQRVWSGESLAG